MAGFGGLSDSLKYTEFEFDSLQAQNSLNTQYYTTDWPLFLLGKPLSNLAALKILQVEIPFSFYVFNSSNNTFYLSESTGSQGPFLVTIPVGNYSTQAPTSILTALGTALTNASAGGSNAFTYTVTYNALVQKLTVTSSNASVFTLSFGSSLYDKGWTNPRLWLGFSGGFNVSDGGGVLNAPSVIQLTGPNYMLINSIALGATVKLYLPADYETGGLLAADGPPCCKVPINVQPGGIVYWQDPDPTKYFDLENQMNLAQVDFYCSLGDNPAVVDFNGNSFSIKLGILTNESQHNDFLGGGKQNDRVMFRSFPTGAGFSSF